MAKLVSPKTKILKCDMPDMPYWKIIFGYNLTMDCQIYATFCSKTQYATAMTVERQKFRNSKIQDGG